MNPTRMIRLQAAAGALYAHTGLTARLLRSRANADLSTKGDGAMRRKPRRIGVALGVAALAGLGALGQAGGAVGAARHVPRASLCARSHDPYTESAQVLRSCGDAILPLLRVTPLPGGGHAYDYGSYTRLIPPAHFSPLRASDRKLAEYGFPTRKQLGKRWYGVMRRFRSVAPATPYLAAAPRVLAGACSSPHYPPVACAWSGELIGGSRTFSAVQAIWTEPHFLSGCSNDAFGQWVGIGGTGQGQVNLGQEGTTFNMPGFGQHQAFIETIINNSGKPVAASVSAHPGKSFFASMSWNSSSKVFSYFMQNDVGTTYNANSRTDESPNLSTAEVISERPLVNGNTAELSDYGSSLAVSGASAKWGSGSGWPSPTHVVMEDPNGIVLSDPSALSGSGNWSMDWSACGPHGS